MPSAAELSPSVPHVSPVPQKGEIVISRLLWISFPPQRHFTSQKCWHCPFLDRTHDKDPQASLIEELTLTAPHAKKQKEHTEKAITLVLEEKINWVC